MYRARAVIAGLVLFGLTAGALRAQQTELDFSNTERSDHAATDGMLYYDKNYYSDFAELDGDGGGLAIYTDGQWGALLSTENTSHMTPLFGGLRVQGNVGIGTSSPNDRLHVSGGSVLGTV